MLLFHPTDHCFRPWYKGVLQSLLRARPDVRSAWRQVWSITEKGHSELDEKQSLSLWIPDFLLHHVFPNALEYISGILRRTGSETGGDTVVDLQAALALGLPWYTVSPRCGAVCFRLLQRDAHVYGAGIDYHGAFQTPQLVRLLSNGYYDPAHLQGEMR